VQAAVREHNVYCRTEPKTTAGCKYSRTRSYTNDLSKIAISSVPDCCAFWCRPSAMGTCPFLHSVHCTDHVTMDRCCPICRGRIDNCFAFSILSEYNVDSSTANFDYPCAASDTNEQRYGTLIKPKLPALAVLCSLHVHSVHGKPTT